MRTGRPKEHGLSNTQLHNAWRKMHDRCSNPRNGMFHRYGARGIKVCERWHDLLAFVSDMGPHPGAGYSLDRIDVNGDYTPENCRWATIVEQMNNTSRTLRVEYKGQTKSLPQWCRELGLDYHRTRQRLSDGWSVAKAFAQANPTKNGKRKDNVLITHGGETLTLAEWGRRVSRNPISIRRRLKRGMTTDQALFGEFQRRSV